MAHEGASFYRFGAETIISAGYGNGAIRGYMGLVADRVTGPICLKAGLFCLPVGLGNIIIRIDKK